MKTIPKPHTFHRRQITTLALNVGLFAGLSILPLHAQNDENIPAGYTEDEWYDPGDWFDNNNAESAGNDWRDNYGWSDSASKGYENRTYGRGATYGRGTTYGRDRTQDRDSTAGTDTRYYYYWDPIVIGWVFEPDNQTTRNRQDRSDRNQQTGSDRDEPMKTTSFNGKVDGFKKVNLKDREGKLDEHTFVRIRLKNDEARVVSLGKRVDLSDLDLEKGDRISVSGRNTRIDNRDVLVANRIKVGDETFRIRKANQPDTSQQVALKGTVEDYSKTSLSDDKREKNLLVRLELEDGKSCVVDLGQDTNLSDLDIEEGSKIRVQGEKTKVDGKSLIVARKISVDGDSTRVRDKSQRDESTSGDREISRDYSRRDSRYETRESVSSDY